MASYLRPRRGTATTAASQLTGTNCLKRGEVFFEVPTGGVGTGIGRIVMGDGTTDYSNLPAFMEQNAAEDETIAFVDDPTVPTDIPTSNTTALANMVKTATLKTLFTNLKQLLVNYNSQITTLNNDCVQCSDTLESISVEERDADTLGGQYTASDITSIKSSLTRKTNNITSGLQIITGDFTAAEDGYFSITSQSSGSYSIWYVKDANGTAVGTIEAINTSCPYVTVFLRKGMIMSIYTATGTNTCSFCPLISVK